MRERFAVFATSKVTLQRDKFGPLAERDAMVDVVVVHVAVNAVSCSPDAAGDGCGIEAHLVRQRLQ